MPIQFHPNRLQQNLVNPESPVQKQQGVQNEKPFLTLENLERSDFVAGCFNRVPASEVQLKEKLSEAYLEVFDVKDPGNGDPLSINLREGQTLENARGALKQQFDSELSQNSGFLGKLWAKFKNVAGNAGASFKQFFGTETRPVGMLREKAEIAGNGGKAKSVYNFKLTSDGNKTGGDIQVDRRSYSGLKHYSAQFARLLLTVIPINPIYYAITGKSLLWQYTAKGQLHTKSMQDAKDLQSAITQQVKEIVITNKNGLEEKDNAGKVGELNDFLRLAYNKDRDSIRKMVREELKKPEGSFLNKSQALTIDDKRWLINPLRWFGSEFTAEAQDANRLADAVADKIADGILEGALQGHLHLTQEVISDDNSKISEQAFLKQINDCLNPFKIAVSGSKDDVTKAVDSKTGLLQLKENFQKIREEIGQNANLGVKNQQVALEMVDSLLRDIDIAALSLDKVAVFVKGGEEGAPSLEGINKDITKILAESSELTPEAINERFGELEGELAELGEGLEKGKAGLLEIHHKALTEKVGELRDALGACKKAALLEKEIQAGLKAGSTRATITDALGKLDGLKQTLAEKNPLPLLPGSQGALDAFHSRLAQLGTALTDADTAYSRASDLKEKGGKIADSLRDGTISFTDLPGHRDWNTLLSLSDRDTRSLEAMDKVYGFKAADLDPAAELETFKCNAAAAALGLPATDKPEPALLKLFTQEAHPLLGTLKTAAQMEGFLAGLSKLGELSNRDFSPSVALEFIKTSESLLPDPTEAAALAKIFVTKGREEFNKFLNNHSDWKTAAVDLKKAVQGGSIPELLEKLKLGKPGTPTELLQAFLKFPKLGDHVTEANIQSIQNVLHKLGNLEHPSATNLNSLDSKDLAVLKEVANVLANDGVYSPENLAALEAQTKAANLVATLGNFVVKGDKGGLGSDAVQKKLLEGLEVDPDRKAEFEELNSHLGQAVDNYFDSKKKITELTGELDYKAEQFAKMLDGASKDSKSKIDKDFVKSKVKEETTQEAFRQINRLTTAITGLESIPDSEVSGNNSETYFKNGDYFQRALGDGEFKNIKKTFPDAKSFEALELGISNVANGRQKKTLLKEFDRLTEHAKNLAEETKAFSELRETLNQSQKNNPSYGEEWFKQVFSLPVGNVAAKRDPNEARKRLLVGGEFESNYHDVSKKLLALNANRFEALESQGLHEKVNSLREKLSPPKIKELYTKNPAELGRMFRIAESTKGYSKQFWLASYHAEVLSDSSAKLARFELATLDYGKLGFFDKFKQKVFGISPEKPAISKQVEKFFHAYPELNKSISQLVATQNSLEELDKTLSKIDGNLADLEKQRDKLLKQEGKLMARHATALAVAEMWQSQRVESAHFNLRKEELLPKLAPLGINTETYPDIEMWMEEATHTGVEAWLMKQAEGMEGLLSDIAKQKGQIAQDMENIAKAFADELKQLESLGEKISKNGTRFTTASTQSLKQAGLTSWDATTLPQLFKEFDQKFFSQYGKELQSDGKTKQLQQALHGIRDVYETVRNLDRKLDHGDIDPGEAEVALQELRGVLEESVSSIERKKSEGGLADHDFALGGNGTRDKFKKALLAHSNDWPRSPLREMEYLVSQRMDRLQTLAGLKTIQNEGGNVIRDDDDLEVFDDGGFDEFVGSTDTRNIDLRLDRQQRRQQSGELA